MGWSVSRGKVSSYSTAELFRAVIYWTVLFIALVCTILLRTVHFTIHFQSPPNIWAHNLQQVLLNFMLLNSEQLSRAVKLTAAICTFLAIKMFAIYNILPAHLGLLGSDSETVLSA